MSSKESSRILNQIIKGDTIHTYHKVSLKDFYIPEWYKLHHNLPAGGLDMELSCVNAVQLLSSNYLESNLQDTVWWEDLKLTRRRTWPLPLALGITLSTLVFFVIWYIKKDTWKKAVQANVLNHYKARSTQIVQNDDWNRVVEYFSEHYQNQDFQILV